MCQSFVSSATSLFVQIGISLSLLPLILAVLTLGLDFFHLECSGADDNKWLNLDNVGVVVIEDGEVTLQELKQNFSKMWKTN